MELERCKQYGLEIVKVRGQGFENYASGTVVWATEAEKALEAAEITIAGLGVQLAQHQKAGVFITEADHRTRMNIMLARLEAARAEAGSLRILISGIVGKLRRHAKVKRSVAKLIDADVAELLKAIE